MITRIPTMRWALAAVCSLLLVSRVYGFGSGAPAETCNTFTPKHGVAAQSSPTTYAITVSQTNVASDGQSAIDVWISSTENEPFKGFLIKAVQAGSADPVGGAFTNIPSNVRTIKCNDYGGSAATHRSPASKQSIALRWVPQPGFNGKIQFIATVVKEAPVFWVGIRSNTVNVGSSSQSPPITFNEIPQNSPPQSKQPITSSEPAEVNSIYQSCSNGLRSCFGNPEGCIDKRNCQYVTAYARQNGIMDFQIAGRVNRREWAALALSHDNIMGDDLVTECVVKRDGTAEGYQSYNTDDKKNQRITSQAQSFKVTRARYVDGYVLCNFQRPLSFEFLSKRYDLANTSYVLFLGGGPIRSDTNNELGYHDIIPIRSQSPVDLTSLSLVRAGSSSNDLVIIHGCFMVAAWVGTVSIAIFMARYYKGMWPDTTHCGERVWFSWHRGLNILTATLSITGSILIVIEVGGWYSQWRDNPHPILGSITTGLTLLQVVFGFLRPHPGTSKRPFFNWAHFIMGIVTHMVAISTMFFAVPLPKSKLPEYFYWVLIAYVAFHVVVFLSMEVFECLSSNMPASNQIAMKDFNLNGHHGYTTQTDNSMQKNLMLTLYVFGIVVFAGLLIATVIVYGNN